MSILKPVVKTSLLAALFFLVVVSLGIKYHWVEKMRPSEQQKEIPIPVAKEANQSVLAVDDTDPVKGKENEFEPEMITDVDYADVVANMDKTQILEACTELYTQTEHDPVLKELAIGDCVVSNYSESEDGGITRSKNNRQVQTLRKNATLACWKELQLGGSEFSQLEQQLLIGVCVANRLSLEK